MSRKGKKEDRFRSQIVTWTETGDFLFNSFLHTLVLQADIEQNGNKKRTKKTSFFVSVELNLIKCCQQHLVDKYD